MWQQKLPGQMLPTAHETSVPSGVADSEEAVIDMDSTVTIETTDVLSEPKILVVEVGPGTFVGFGVAVETTGVFAVLGPWVGAVAVAGGTVDVPAYL